MQYIASISVLVEVAYRSRIESKETKTYAVSDPIVVVLIVVGCKMDDGKQ